MSIPLFQVDAFTDRPFSGNPAAVCLLEEEKDDAWLQAVAREMNLSETSFVWTMDDGFKLRWFTPTVEVDLCGHATLAAAHVLWEESLLPPNRTAVFHTRSGRLTAEQKDHWIEMDFPADPTSPAKEPDGLGAALGVTLQEVEKAKVYYVAQVATEEALRGMQPDFQALLNASVFGIAVTCRAETSDTYDFLSRFFAPAAGIDEDPVTGSAHATLASYWAPRLGKHSFSAYQASARGGAVRVRLDNDRAMIAGQAVTVMRSELA